MVGACAHASGLVHRLDRRRPWVRRRRCCGWQRGDVAEAEPLLDRVHVAGEAHVDEPLPPVDLVAVTPRGQAVKFNLDAFLRADTKTRMETYKLGLEVGAYTRPEIRTLEDRPPISRSKPGSECTTRHPSCRTSTSTPTAISPSTTPVA